MGAVIDPSGQGNHARPTILGHGLVTAQFLAPARSPAGFAATLFLFLVWSRDDAWPVEGVPFRLSLAVLVGASVIGREAAGRLQASRRSGNLDLAVVAGMIALGALIFGALDRVLYGLEPSHIVLVAVGGGSAIAFGASVSVRHRIALGTFLLLSTVAGIWLITDVQIWQATPHPLYDLNVYVSTAARWMHGGQPYLTAPLTHLPPTPQSDYFLYPPPLLPIFALLSLIPHLVLATVWLAAITAAAVISFRLIGASWPWALALTCSPLLMDGLHSGNVASITFLLFVLAGRSGERIGGLLVVNALTKVQSAVPSLWLVRERRWSALASGVVAVAAICLVTLPLVGLNTWAAWFESLRYRAETQVLVPHLFGLSLAATWPSWLFAAMSVVAVASALALRGRRSLAALGLATIVISPSLWEHGFVFDVPAILTIDSGVIVLLMLGLGPAPAFIWIPVAAAAASVTLSRWSIRPDPVHPLGGTGGPWGDDGIVEEAAAQAAGPVEGGREPTGEAGAPPASDVAASA